VADVIFLALILNHEEIMQISKEISSLADKAVNGGLRDIQERMVEEEKQMSDADDIDYNDEEVDSVVNERMRQNYYHTKIDEKIDKLQEVM
jgi:hypothetical protein